MLACVRVRVADLHDAKIPNGTIFPLRESNVPDAPSFEKCVSILCSVIFWEVKTSLASLRG